MWTFNDFDAWGDTIRGACLRLACDAVDTGVWTLGRVDLGGVVLQVASEGGGNVCYGANMHAGPTLFVPLTRVADHVVNGERLDDNALLAIPRGADFLIRVRRVAHAWCSIALPFDVAACCTPTSPSARVTSAAGALPRLRRIATAIATSLVDRPPDSPAHLAAGRELAAAALACLPSAPRPRAPLGRPRLDRVTIVRRAMDVLDTAPTVPTTADLARDVGVTSRTLLRTFQDAYGMPPKQYLMLRELHVVRRSLRDGGGEDDTVADILTRHGVWEFGRFAGRYRQLFGELPSETLRRARN
jgi:AraC family ethanolamine operon transcriptional activator